MEKTGLVDDIIRSVMFIDSGRKNFMIDGSERHGRIYFSRGILRATQIFTDIRSLEEPCEIMAVSEQLFLKQELHFCAKSDKPTISSLTNAIQSFDDAMRSFEVANSVEYKAAEATYPTSSAYRVKGLPKDAFHVACNAHRTRIYNAIRTPGITPLEKALYKLRAENMLVIKGLYMEKQRLALGITKL